jgi:ribosomal protein L11 methyltransferase
VSVRVSAAEAEIARAQFLSLVPEGFEELEGVDVIELATYTDERGEAQIRAAFPSVYAAPVDPGWEDGWRAFHHALRVGGLWIGPPWEAAPEGVPAVVIEPGRAFGTGAHATTRACIELLSTVERGSLLDAGCGSGVVAIAAARLGFAPVVAVDVDEVAVAVTQENASRNGISLEVQSLDVLTDDLPRADVAVANIELAAVEALLARRPGLRTITSGYLTHESPKAEGWRHEKRLELDGWAADLFSRME